MKAYEWALSYWAHHRAFFFLVLFGSLWKKEERCLLLPVSFPRERKPYLEQQWCSTIKRLHFSSIKAQQQQPLPRRPSVNEMHDWKARAASFKRLLCCFYVVMWPLTISASKAQLVCLAASSTYYVPDISRKGKTRAAAASATSSSPGWGCKGTKQTPSSHIHKHSTNMGQWWCSQTCIACGNLC